MSTAERQKKYREKQKEAGLERVSAWVHKSRKAEFYDLVLDLQREKGAQEPLPSFLQKQNI